MKELIFYTQQNELEQYADEVATEVFLPLWKNDQLWLEMVQDNPIAFYQSLCELSEKWRVPVEEDADVQQAIKLYAPTEGN